jgi:hypothetical protein
LKIVFQRVGRVQEPNITRSRLQGARKLETFKKRMAK